jgi:hypothetical protein
MKFSRVFYFVLALAAGALLWSCGGSGNKKGADSDEFAKAEKDSLENRMKDLLYNMPSPSEIPYLLEATGAEFNQTLINDHRKADSYASRSEKAALNLGIYVADIGYLTSYDKTQEAIDHLNACKSLADNLGIVESFDVALLKEFESNISNKDSLAVLLNRTVQKTEVYLKNDTRSKLAALLVTGSFVEGLYISTGLIKSYPKNLLPDDARNLVLTPLMRVVLEQRQSVDELLEILSTAEQAEPVPTIMADLTALQASYRALNIEEQIRTNKANLVLTDKNLIEITKIVEKLRGFIVE